MGLSEQIRQQLISTFKAEQAEHVQNITQGLLQLEKTPDLADRETILEDIFREAHSLKGSARAVNMMPVGALGHSLENVLLAAKEGQIAFSPELFDLLYRALDGVEVAINHVEQEGTATIPSPILALLAQLDQMCTAVSPQEVEAQPEPEAMVTSPADEPETVSVAEEVDLPATAVASPPNEQTPSTTNDETIRVSVSKLDALMAQFSELLAAKIRAEQRLAEIREIQSLATAWNKEWRALRPHYNRLLRHEQNGYNKDILSLISFATSNQERLRTLNAKSNVITRQFANDNLHLQLIIDDLQEEIKRVRMLPLSTITVTFGRMVRDLARQQNKQINLNVIGGETELDKRVLEQVKDPLIHLLRNAIDHGIEPAEIRQKAGKPAEGNITITAQQQGSNIIIMVGDDGGGLNLEEIRRSALRKGVVKAEELEQMSDNEIARLIFYSGLSTSRIITDISGRGVGLDVVRQNVEELHGTLNISFEPNQGTVFTMKLPLTLASTRGLLVSAGGQRFALPLSTVERMLQVPHTQIATVKGREAITHQGKPIALAWLEDLLQLPPTSRTVDTLTIVIVAVAEKRLGLVVDDLQGEQEIVTKSLGPQLLKVGGMAGATVLGSGEVLLVLHTADLVKLAEHADRSHGVVTVNNNETTVQRRNILVVDDSITTRTLEKNILEAAGYQVRLATDGEEALGVLASENLPNLIISDVNMPRLDGIEMTGRLKKDERYRKIPIILVTSLDSPADKARGIEVGADAYIIKSSFDQGNLLDTIEQLL